MNMWVTLQNCPVKRDCSIDVHPHPLFKTLMLDSWSSKCVPYLYKLIIPEVQPYGLDSAHCGQVAVSPRAVQAHKHS